nr:hypothetical protein [uncultured Cellulosilyticum sp.]
MKKEIVIIDEILGKINYEGEYWRLENSILMNFNNTKLLLSVKVHIMYSEFTEYKLGIGDWEEDDFDIEEIEGYDRYQKDIKSIYMYYINNLIETTQFIEAIIIKDYNTCTNEMNCSYIQSMVTEEDFKLILESNKNPLDLVQIKDITLFDDRIRILGSCKWHINNEFGINLYRNHEYSIGNLDVIY